MKLSEDVLPQNSTQDECHPLSSHPVPQPSFRASSTHPSLWCTLYPLHTQDRGWGTSQLTGQEQVSIKNYTMPDWRAGQERSRWTLQETSCSLPYQKTPIRPSVLLHQHQDHQTHDQLCPRAIILLNNPCKPPLSPSPFFTTPPTIHTDCAIDTMDCPIELSRLCNK